MTADPVRLRRYRVPDGRFGEPMHVLVVEENPSSAAVLGTALEASGHSSTLVQRNLEALNRHADHDAMVVDLGLPGMSGFDVITRLRIISQIPILALSGRRSERDVLRALRLGADDFLFKPANLTDLIARLTVAASLRHHVEPADPTPPVTVDGLTVDLAGRTVHHDGEAVALTRTEFDVLAVLCERRGQAVRREYILDRIWGDTLTSTSRSLSVHLAQLRAKLCRPGLITTVRGVGYRFD